MLYHMCLWALWLSFCLCNVGVVEIVVIINGIRRISFVVNGIGGFVYGLVGGLIKSETTKEGLSCWGEPSASASLSSGWSLLLLSIFIELVLSMVLVELSVGDSVISGTTAKTTEEHWSPLSWWVEDGSAAKWLISCCTKRQFSLNFLIVVLVGICFDFVLKFLTCLTFVYTVYGGRVVQWVWWYGRVCWWGQMLVDGVHGE